MQYVIVPIIFLFGLLIGNFATSIFHRLPRKIMISGFDNKSTRPPFCSNCGHLLRFYEYLPLLSWFSTLGKCNYCYFSIPKIYIVMEITTGFFAVALYSLLDDIEFLFFYFSLATLILLSTAIYLKHGFIADALTTSIVILGLIFRTLVDHQIFLGLADLSIAFIGVCTICKAFDYELFSTTLLHTVLPISLWCQNYYLIIMLGSLGIIYLSSNRLGKIVYPLALALMFIVSLWENL